MTATARDPGQPAAGGLALAAFPQASRGHYAVVALPGGPRAEAEAGAPLGLTRLLERLLYRRNARAGHPLDRLGGKFGSSWERERVLVEVAFPDRADLDDALARLEAWWFREPAAEEDVAAAAARVEQEVSVQRSQPGQRLARAARTALGAPDPEPAPGLPRTWAGAARWLQALPAVGAAAVVGPVAPVAPAAGHWRPPAPRATTGRGPVAAPPAGGGRRWVGAALRLPGLVDDGGLAARLVAAPLRFTSLIPSLERARAAAAVGPTAAARIDSADSLVLLAAGCDDRDAERLRDLLGAALEEAATAEPSLAARCAWHWLTARHDDPRERAEEEAMRMLHGAEPLAATLERCAAAGAEVAAAARTPEPATVVLSDGA